MEVKVNYRLSERTKMRVDLSCLRRSKAICIPSNVGILVVICMLNGRKREEGKGSKLSV